MAIISVVILPNFVFARSDTLRVNQPVNGIDVVPSPGAGGSTSGDNAAPFISDVAVKATDNGATILWSTNELSLGKVSWGPSIDYGDGEISVEQYAKVHSAEISKLQSNLKYYFRILAFDQSGNQRVYEGSFLTLVEPDTKGPQNVSNFIVKPAQDRMNLFWNNPLDSDFESVRVVRSERFYPLDPFNGVVIYEGSGQQASDLTVVPGKTYYYSAFAKDVTGNYSTGSLGVGMILWYSESKPQYPDAPVVDIKFPQAPGAPSNSLSFEDFMISYNNGGTITNSNSPIPSTDIQITVPAEKLPEGTTSLILTIKDSLAEEYTYLFNYNKLTKEFFVDIPAVLVKQAYNLTISIFDRAARILQTVVGSLSVSKSSIVQPAEKSVANSNLLILLSLPVILAFGWLLLSRGLIFWPTAGSPPPAPRARKKIKK